MQKKYNIGLDIGTNSVGWAVVEAETQKIIKKGRSNNRKALWGVRLFDSASTAEQTRNFRSSRRRYDRRRNRIKLLQNEFYLEINKVDPNFFKKLKESKYLEKDATNKTVLLSSAEKKEIKQYNETYKTIYHLRQKLIQDGSKEDIRLVYLAIHHILKYRGNFTQAGTDFNVENLNICEKIKNIIDALCNSSFDLGIVEDYVDVIDLDKIANIIVFESKNDVKTYLKNELSLIIDNKNFISEFAKMIIGNKFVIKKIFNIENLENKLSISFDDIDFVNKFSEIQTEFGDEVTSFLELFKDLYDTIFLKKVFKNMSNPSISSLKVGMYDQHKEDLKFLKEVLKSDRNLYNKFFKNKKSMCFYEEYLHNISSENKTSYETFKDKLLKYLPNEVEKLRIDDALRNKYEEKIKDRIINGSFMPKITSTDNGSYPHQLNKKELIKIIENQGKYYPFLREKIGNTYKLVKILEFKIPYYVGPLVSNNKSRFAWMEKKVDNVKITPYNFDDIVDKEITAENFIKRMISHCSYLLNEYALPNNSVLYSKYKVMNELKQIKVQGEKLSNKQQQIILEEFFMKTKGTITDSKFKKYLHSNSDFDMFDSNIEVSGYSSDGKFANNMQSYYDFFGPNGIFFNTPYNEKDAENIIEWVTVFEDKEILETKIRKEYPHLPEENLKTILGKNYSGWGNLSEKLLITPYYVDEESKIKKSIIDLMKETDKNFMQIINDDKYNFQKMIKDYNQLTENTKLNYDLVKDLSTSPSNKKGIYQSLKVVNEIIRYMGYNPENIIIEMARNEESKKRRKDERIKKLIKIYEEATEFTKEYNKIIKDLKQIDKGNNNLETEKLYLYYLQEGKCLYCGHNIDINSLNGINYEVDHILPRTLIKDDSFDNKALVCREHNQDKKDSFVLPEKFRNNQLTKELWERLKKNGLITNKKMYRLTRKYYSEEDVVGFINRQIVETRQITKHVANILSDLYDSNVIYLKASYSHDYRMKYDLFKIRQINDYHHAHDAYLAAVLGEYKEKYMKKNINFDFVKILNKRLKEMNKSKDLIYGYAINCLDEDVSDIVSEISKKIIDEKTGELLFDVKNFNKMIKNTLYRNDIIISKKTEIRTGQFYHQNMQKKGKKGVQLKSNMPIEWYGSYTSLNPSYAIMVSYTKNGKEYSKMMGMPILLRNKSMHEKTIYMRKLLNLKENDSIIISNKRIPFYSLFNWNNQICYLVGASGNVEVCNAKQFYYDKHFYEQHKYALNKIFNNDKNNIDNYENQLDEIIKYIICKIEKEYTLYSNIIESAKKMINYHDLQTLDKEKKVEMIKQFTKLLNCKSDCANMKFLNDKYSGAFGKKNDRIISSTKIINNSVTGLKESTYEF